jgi:hypothetical protein
VVENFQKPGLANDDINEERAMTKKSEVLETKIDKIK